MASAVLNIGLGSAAAGVSTAAWTDQEDRFLIFHGRRLKLVFGDEQDGYEFITEYDLHREPEEGVERVAYLRREKPELVARLEASADGDCAVQPHLPDF
jgi:hypothetical protein